MSNGDLQEPDLERISDVSVKALHAKDTEEIFMGVVRSLSLISEHSNKVCGVPPPKDFDDTFLSGSFVSNDSLLIDDISLISDLSEIKDKNNELRNTVRHAVKTFRDTSKEFLSHSIIFSEKKSLLVNELESMKKLLANAIEEKKSNKSFTLNEPPALDKEREDLLKNVHDQIFLIQAEIRIAAERLGETEALIHNADQENVNLAQKLHKLDESLTELELREDENMNEGCRCGVF